MSESQKRVMAAAVLVILILFVVINSMSDRGTGSQVSVDESRQISDSTNGRNQQAAATIFTTAENIPLMIRYTNWREEFGPAYVYARERDLPGMLQMNAPVEKMLMIASYAEAERLMARADELKAAGITTVGMNTENGAGMTPPNEMQTLGSTDPNVNIVARVATLARQNGFKVMWGPVRNMTDQVSDEMIRTIMEAGVTGLAMQEQKFIENQPADSRLAAVERTRERYLRLADDVGVDGFNFHVQIMHQRCPSLPNCVTFVEGLESIPVESIAIWSNGPIPVNFVSSIRGG